MAEKALPIILVVEEDHRWVAVWRGQLSGVCTIQHAQTEADAERLWDTGKGIRLVVVGACTYVLELQAWFHAQRADLPIVSISTIDDPAQTNHENGAVERLNKAGVAEKVKEILGQILVPLEVDHTEQED